MNFPGDNTIKLTRDALMQAIEGALNAARKDGEDYIRVTALSSSYSYGPWEVSITTDAPEPIVTELHKAAA